MWCCNREADNVTSAPAATELFSYHVKYQTRKWKLLRFCALNSLKNRCISCTIHRKIYESFYVSHFSLICTHASWNIDYYKVRPQTLSILNEKKKTLCLVSSKYGIFWRLFKTFQSLLSLSESDRKWCIS